ncbi:MAG TPA: hypothetical protein ENJ82_01475 [Bacteroidetes bacterium]|nr:hypothetical protein [Bacteroidota bacterium]
MKNKPNFAAAWQGRAAQKSIQKMFQNTIFLFGILLLQMSGAVSAQQLSFTASGVCGEYEVSYTFNSGSGVAGLDMLVTITYDSTLNAPDLTSEVPSGSWLFDQGDTDITISQYSSASGKVVYAVYADRADGIGQTGTGHVLNLRVTDGIVIAVEDFPGKRKVPLPPQITYHQSGGFTIVSKKPLSQVRMLDINGKELLKKYCSGAFLVNFPEVAVPSNLSQILLVEVAYKNGQLFRKKFLR